MHKAVSEPSDMKKSLADQTWAAQKNRATIVHNYRAVVASCELSFGQE